MANKTDLIDALAGKLGISKREAEQGMDAAFSFITETLKKGEKLTISGFGAFDVSARAARTGRNPKTGESIQIPASKTPRFKAGKGLKDAIQ